MDHLPALAAVLASPQGRAITAAGEPGKIVRLFRRAHDWTQQDWPDRVGWSQPTVLGGTIALAVTALLPHGVATAGRITTADVSQCWTGVLRKQSGTDPCGQRHS